MRQSCHHSKRIIILHWAIFRHVACCAAKLTCGVQCCVCCAGSLSVWPKYQHATTSPGRRTFHVLVLLQHPVSAPTVQTSWSDSRMHCCCCAGGCAAALFRPCLCWVCCMHRKGNTFGADEGQSTLLDCLCGCCAVHGAACATCVVFEGNTFWC
jgi:hypothetical protein